MTAEVYGTQSCGYCRRAKNILKAKGIEYQEFIVGQDISAEALSSTFGMPLEIERRGHRWRAWAPGANEGATETGGMR